MKCVEQVLRCFHSGDIANVEPAIRYMEQAKVNEGI